MTQLGADVLHLRSEDFLADPAPRLAELRRSGGVCPVDHGGTAHGGSASAGSDWLVVTTAELAREVLRDTETFSSAIIKHIDPPAEVVDQVAAIRARGWPYTPALGASDAPRHTRNRTLVNKAFTPRAMTALEPMIREAAQRLAEALPDGQEVDFLTAFGEALPVLAISRVLGLPDERSGDIRRWSIAAVATIGADPSPESWVRHEEDLLDFQQTMAAKLADPHGDGLIGVLASGAGEVDSGEVDPTALLLTLLRELVVAGNETTGKFLAEAVRMIGPDPEVWEAIRTDPAHADVVVEEALRLASPTQSVMRRVTRNTELGGVPMAKGTLVLVSLASANRDEQAVSDPDGFDADRDRVRQHLAFGLGPHMCVGAGLARMESRIALQVLADLVERIVPSSRPPAYNRSYTIRGPVELFATVYRRRSQS
jgi:cytochrome P450